MATATLGDVAAALGAKGQKAGNLVPGRISGAGTPKTLSAETASAVAIAAHLAEPDAERFARSLEAGHKRPDAYAPAYSSSGTA